MNLRPCSILLAAAIMFAHSMVYSQGELEWRLLQTSPGTESRHDDVFFVNENLGWIVNGQGYIYRTTNGGAFWHLQTDVPEYLRSVGFADSLRGWTGTILSFANPLYETSNGGETWSLVQGLPNPRPQGICGIWVVDDSVVYCSGQYTGPAIVIKSTNRGTTWTSMDLAGLATGLVDCYFTSRDSGFVVGHIDSSGDRGVILFTSDGGGSWVRRYSGIRTGEGCWKISFPSRDVGYVSIEDFSISPVYFLKTTDGGATWQDKLFLTTYESEQGIGFVTPTLGWIGGWGNPTYQTTDGGDTWQSFGQAWPNINRFRFLSDTLGYAVGTRVYKYSRESTTAIEPGHHDELPASTELLQNYPNPFNPSTIINYQQAASYWVTLKVFDVLGREVTTLIDKQLEPGSHSVEWNGEDAVGRECTGGIYFCRMTSGGRQFTTKMLLLR